MLILLPPSEGKATSPRRGRALNLESLSMSDLNPTRAQLIEALQRLAQGPRPAAMEALGLSPGLADEVDKDAALSSSPTLPAERLYTGVLYDALDLATLPPAATRRARRDIVVFSALFGVLHLNDRVPPYRLSPDARLPRLGTIASAWREPLAQVMPEAAGKGPVVDLRSGPYAAMWRPSGDVAARTLSIRVLHEARPGDPTSRSIVSHFNKATKGRLVRDLMLNESRIRSTDAVIDALRSCGWTLETDDASRRQRTKPRAVDVIVAQV